MYTIKNRLINHLDQDLVEKIIQIFFYYSNENNDGTLLIKAIDREEIKNLLEEKIIVKFSDTKKTLIITLCFIVQDLKIEQPVGGGCPRFFYHGIDEINFVSVNMELAEKMQKRFKEFLKKTEGKGLPVDLVRSIQRQ